MSGTESHASPAGGGEDELFAAVRAFQRDEPGSFEGLYRRMWGPVSVRASRMGLSSHEAEEIAQKTMVRVYLYAGRASFRRPEQVWAWVYTIAVREVYKHWRKKRPDVVPDEALDSWATLAAGPQPGPEDAAASAEAVADVEGCIAQLDEAERAALLGVLVGEMTFREAAKAHGLTLGQLKHRYERARRAVRDCMRAKGHEVE